LGGLIGKERAVGENFGKQKYILKSQNNAGIKYYKKLLILD
jgi:hypothetical protein